MTSHDGTTKSDGWLKEERLTHMVIGAFFQVYNTLGFGFLESVYVLALERELKKLGLRVAREFSVRIYYDGEELTQYRLDMVVNETLVLEIKSTYDLHPAAKRKTYNYLRATNLEVGLLLHFGPEAKFYRFICSHKEKSRK